MHSYPLREGERHAESSDTIQPASLKSVYKFKLSSLCSLSLPRPISGSWTAGWIKSKLKPNPWLPHSKTTMAQVSITVLFFFYFFCILSPAVVVASKALWFRPGCLFWSSGPLSRLRRPGCGDFLSRDWSTSGGYSCQDQALWIQ